MGLGWRLLCIITQSTPPPIKCGEEKEGRLLQYNRLSTDCRTGWFDPQLRLSALTQILLQTVGS